jgi:hypothetical protein
MKCFNWGQRNLMKKKNIHSLKIVKNHILVSSKANESERKKEK